MIEVKGTVGPWQRYAIQVQDLFKLILPPYSLHLNISTDYYFDCWYICMVFLFVVLFKMKNAYYNFPEPKEPRINSLSDLYPNTVCLVSYKTKKSFKTVFFKDNSYWLIPWKELTNPNSHYITSTFSSGLDRKPIICVHVSSIINWLRLVVSSLKALSCRQSVSCSQRPWLNPGNSMVWERNGHEEDEHCFCPAESWLQHQGEILHSRTTGCSGKFDDVRISKWITRG